MIYRLLICGGRDYGRRYDIETGEWVVNEGEVRRFNRVLERAFRQFANNYPEFGDDSSFGSTNETVSDEHILEYTSISLRILRQNDITVEIIHGDARGADTLAKEFAEKYGLTQHACPANWNKYGKRAGFVRNKFMLDEYSPDFVIGFPGGAGTKMMIDISKRAGVPTYEVK